MRHSEPHSPRSLTHGATHLHRRELPVLDSSTTSSLPRALASRVRGEVRFDSGSRALYATDASNYREVPMGLVVPRDVEDVVETIEVCREFGVPILPRGGGTSLAGQCTNVAVVIDFSKHLRRIDIDEASSTAWVEPGVVLDDLRTAARPHGLTFGPDPSTHNRCTLGGMIGNNSCGVHSMMAGTTADNVVALDVVTYDGARFLVNGVEPDSSIPRTTGASPSRSSAASAWGSAVERMAGPCARATWSRVRRRTPRGAERTCCSRPCAGRSPVGRASRPGERSICASRARAASETARCTSTSRRTRPSFSRTNTRITGGPARPTCSA